jgi:hypothetical protein
MQLEAEYDKMSVWLKRHVSDHSAINHQHQVARLMFEVANNTLPNPCGYTIAMLEKFMSQSMQVLHSSGSGGHASLWSLRRLWVQTLLGVLQGQLRRVQSSSGQGVCAPGIIQKMHSFDACLGRRMPPHLIDHVHTCVASAADSDTLFYHSNVQKRVLSCIVNKFDQTIDDDDDTYVGLSSLCQQSGLIDFSDIELELNLQRLLTDGVTYAEPLHVGQNSSGDCEDDQGDSDSISEDSSSGGAGGDTDEVSASLHMHSARFSALFQLIPSLDNEAWTSENSDCVTLLSIWLSKFVTEELLFCGTCICSSGWYTSNCWDPKKQKACALEYSIFLIYQVSQ